MVNIPGHYSFFMPQPENLYKCYFCPVFRSENYLKWLMGFSVFAQEIHENKEEIIIIAIFARSPNVTERFTNL